MGQRSLVDAGKDSRDCADKQAVSHSVDGNRLQLQHQVHLWSSSSKQAVERGIHVRGTVQPTGEHSEGHQDGQPPNVRNLLTAASTNGINLFRRSQLLLSVWGQLTGFFQFYCLVL